MNDLSIRVENLGKRYRIGAQKKRYETWRKRVNRFITSPFDYLRTTLTPPSDEEVLWALQDISFEVKQGEVLGIIGRNGSGKSTLLKILSRITLPTLGRADIYGSIGSLLEVGTGFHHELSGRENVYMNGIILGMSKQEVDRKFDEIVAFSEIEKFIDTPVKRYSSGMQVRLAFAVAAHLEPDILIVDEVLAVGDVAFQQKCLGKLEEITQQDGRTVLFVSHNLGTILELCSHAILLNQGQLICSNSTNEVVERYLSQYANQPQAFVTKQYHDGALITQVALLNYHQESVQVIDYDVEFYIQFEFEITAPIRALSQWIRLENQFGVPVLFAWLAYQQAYQPGIYRAICEIPAQLLTPSRYHVDIGLTNHRIQPYNEAHQCLSFDIISKDRRFDPNDQNWGAVYPQLVWQIENQ
jgi:lipopolysaccharide transport system ATP-binding protein